MINYMSGTITHIDGNAVSLLLTTSEIGFVVWVPRSGMFTSGSRITLHGYLHWNQEQGPTLYGFTQQAERALFELLISCSGIGPKMALLIIDQLLPSDIARAIQSGDIKALCSLKGVGAKKAEQIIVQLKDKMDLFVTRWQLAASNRVDYFVQASQALQALDYSRPEVQQALTYVREEGIGESATFDQVMRKALAYLARRT